ncbi:hypothetical protein C1646_770049 [Rhizophagus diaphanus]|nr:hypothetical protein C1646_770049 [Rhizophagus diaphanus] [Rhizophagus sp. MUCL 43196]
MATKFKRVPDWIHYMQNFNSVLEIYKKANGGYMLQNLTLSSWVPLLSGHCVIGKFGNLYVCLEIQSNNEESLTYNWKIYEDMEMSQMIYSETNNDFFVSIKKYIKLSGEISIPDILGLRDPNIIQDLQARVNSVYPNIFNDMIIKIPSETPIICQGIEIKEPGIHLSPKRTKVNNEYVKNLKYKQHEKKDQEFLNNWIEKTIEETNIGSTIFVNTEQYLTSIYTQPSGAGLVGGVNRQQLQNILSIIGVTAQSSKGHYHNKQNEYLEKINIEAEKSAQIALTKAIKHIKAKEERILPTSFDCSWSHCQNANQASGELIFQGNLEGYNHKPVIAFATAKKPRKIKRNDQEYEVYHGNFEKTSRQMEHAILLRIIEKVAPVLEAAHVLLDIGVDGDLNSNKTLNNIPCVCVDTMTFALNLDGIMNFQINNMPPLQNSNPNPPTPYDVFIKVFGHQEFQDKQEAAILEHIKGKHTFVSMRTGAEKTMCYWISAILHGGLTIIISP